MRSSIIKIAPLIEQARTSFWFVPSLMLIVVIILAVVTIYFDAYYIPQHELSFPLIYGTDVDAIRSLLGTIAGAMITVTSIAFSITIVALTLASSQFGPRLLRNFMMDRGTQFVLGAFISTFLFCILIFCAISFEKPYDFKPGVSVVTAIIMTFASVGILIYFIHHVAKSIQADVVIDDVYQELKTNIANIFPTKQRLPLSDLQHISAADVEQFKHKIAITADQCGYVQTINTDKLIDLATGHDVLIQCHYLPGDFVVEGSVVAHVYSTQETPSSLEKNLLKQIALGAYRTPVQDPEFAIHQLVEIALRALSPGINDPYTAITCIDKLNAVLCGLTAKTFPPRTRVDEQGVTRLISKELTFDSIACAAFNQIRQQANHNVAVSIRLLTSLNRLAGFAQSKQQQNFILGQTKMIEQQQNALPLANADLEQINLCIRQIKHTLSKK